jgi:Flp pilus assembly protein TadG
MTKPVSDPATKPYNSGILHRLRRSQSGVVLIEFAFAVPVFMGLGMYGSETAMVAVTNMKVSQAALNLADNASRLGQVDTGVITPTITESDIVTIFMGTKLQTGGIKLLENGRIILSSLESTAAGQQFIRWRRCKGIRNVASAYNDDIDGNGVTDTTFTGMGKGTSKVQSTPTSAVMFVEVEYVYQPIFGPLFVKNAVLRQDAAFNIRDQRNLAAGLFNDVGTNSPTCNKFTAT